MCVGFGRVARQVGDLPVVDLGDQKPLRRLQLLVTDTVHVREDAVACFDERADRHLAVG